MPRRPPGPSLPLASLRVDRFIVFSILANACFLCAYTPWTEVECLKNPCDTWSLTLYISNLVFVSVFALELLLKLIGFGPNAFVKDWGNGIDAFVVVTSIIGLFVDLGGGTRSLRTIRLVSRLEPLKVVAAGIWRAIPILTTVLCTIGFIWFLFAVLGVQLMMGRLWECVDTSTGIATALDEVWHSAGKVRCQGLLFRGGN